MSRKHASQTFLAVLVLSVFAFSSDIPKGTKVTLRLDQTLSSDLVATGDRFTGHLDHDIHFGTDRVMLHKGALINGLVKYARPTFNYQQAGELDLQITSIVGDNVTYDLLSDTFVRMGTMRGVDPNTGRIDNTGARRADIERAGVDVLTGGGGNTPSATVPGTDVSVGGPSTQSGMQVILPTHMKLTFTVVDAKAIKH